MQIFRGELLIASWESIKTKMHYGGFIRVFFDALARIGITISPYYIVMEGLFNESISNIEENFRVYDVSLLRNEDMKYISAIPGKEESEEQLIERLKKGNLCVGIKQNDNLAGFTWCNLTEFAVKGNMKPLKSDEAYLFDAYTLGPFRGRGIAPFVRYQCYKEVAKLGKTKLYSVSGAYNKSSLKFKTKLNAIIVEKHVYIEIFRRCRYSIFLKDYSKRK